MTDCGAAPGTERPLVVKVGGARAVDPAGAVTDVAHLVANGRETVVVHGGSTAVDDALDGLGIDPEYVETPDGVVGRFTDRETMDAVEMAFGKLNTDLVATFAGAGVPAVGLNGVDGDLLTGPRKSAVRVLEDGKRKVRRGDHSGRVESVNGDLLALLLGAGYVPVVGLPMLADDGTPVNVDADRVAAAVAAELGADLVLLTDVAGVYRDPDDPGTRIDRVGTPAAFAELTDAAEGFMGRKVMAAEEALSDGAARVVVADGTDRDPIVRALDGDGTTVLSGAVGDGGAEDVETDGGDEATDDGDGAGGTAGGDETDADGGPDTPAGAPDSGGVGR